MAKAWAVVLMLPGMATAGPSQGDALKVGRGPAYQTPSAAAAVAKNGDHIQIEPGQYFGRPARKPAFVAGENHLEEIVADESLGLLGALYRSLSAAAELGDRDAGHGAIRVATGPSSAIPPVSGAAPACERWRCGAR
jgi:hypothetical protein